MSFKEALSNFINGYEEEPAAADEAPENVETTEAVEEVAATEETTEPEVANEVEEAPVKEEVDAVQEKTEDLKEPKEDTNTDNPVQAKPVTINPVMAELLLEKSGSVAETLSDSDREKLLKLSKDEFIETLKILKESEPTKTGKISKAMKPAKSDPEEDWTLAFFNS